jgi:hypothetical protein
MNFALGYYLSVKCQDMMLLKIISYHEITINIEFKLIYK